MLSKQATCKRTFDDKKISGAHFRLNSAACDKKKRADKLQKVGKNVSPGSACINKRVFCVLRILHRLSGRSKNYIAPK